MQNTLTNILFGVLQLSWDSLTTQTWHLVPRYSSTRYQLWKMIESIDTIQDYQYRIFTVLNMKVEPPEWLGRTPGDRKVPGSSLALDNIVQ